MMTNVRASNLHPTFLLRDIQPRSIRLPTPRETLLSFRREVKGGRAADGSTSSRKFSSAYRRASSGRTLSPLPSARPSSALPEALKLEVLSARDGNPRGSGCLSAESAPRSHQADVLANCLCFYHVGIFLRPTSRHGDVVRLVPGTTFAGLDRLTVSFLVRRWMRCKTSLSPQKTDLTIPARSRPPPLLSPLGGSWQRLAARTAGEISMITSADCEARRVYKQRRTASWL